MFPALGVKSGQQQKQKLFELEIISRISNNESQAKEIGVGGSGNENESDQQFLEWWESIAQISDNVAQARAIGVGGSNDENEDFGGECLEIRNKKGT